MENNMTVFNPEIMLENLDNDKEMCAMIFNDFLENIPEQIKTLEKFINTKSAEDVERTAHTIKGSSSNFGAQALQDIAFKMEKAGKAGDFNSVQEDMPELSSRFETLKKAIEKLLEEWKGL